MTSLIYRPIGIFIRLIRYLCCRKINDFDMKKSYSSRVPYLDISCIQSWVTLNVSDLTVRYIEDEKESMRLLVPEGQSGTLEVYGRRFKEGTLLFVSCDPTPGTERSPELTLEIHHHGMKGIHAGDNARIHLSGVVALDRVDLYGNGFLDMSQAEIRSESFIASLERDSQCCIGAMTVPHFELFQTGTSRLRAENIRCEKLMSVQLDENSVAELKGQAAYLDSYLRGFSTLNAAGLHVQQGDCICTLFSNMTCHVRELKYYQSPTAKLTNCDPEAFYRPFTDAGAFKLLRPLSSDDAWMVANSLKLGNPDHPAEFKLSLGVYPEYKFCALLLVYQGKNTGRRPNLADQSGSNVDAAHLDSCMRVAQTSGGQVLVEVSEDDVDWNDMPEVHKRFLQSRPVLYECMFKSGI